MEYEIRTHAGVEIGYLETSLFITPGVHLSVDLPVLGKTTVLVTKVVIDCDGELPSCEFDPNRKYAFIYVRMSAKLSEWLEAERRKRVKA